MKQISNFVFCDDFIADLKLEERLLPNPYYDYPYLVIGGFLPESSCRMIARHTAEVSEAEAAMVKTTFHGVVDPGIDERIRKTAIHKLPAVMLEEYRNRFAEHQKTIEKYFSIALTTATEVQALEYTKGSFYIKHADDSNEVVNDKGETVGFVQVAPLRKITTVLFVTSHVDTGGDGTRFSGGELVFNYLYDADGSQIRLRPKAGDMIVFPSNPVFSHEVLPVKEGYRLSLVQWHNGISS